MKKCIRKKMVDVSDTVEDCITNIFVGTLSPKKIFDLWNRIADEYDISKCSYLSDSLSRKIKKNIKTFHPDIWKNCFHMILESNWLAGKPWFTLSWLMKQENFVKVVDGNYKSASDSRLPKNAVGTDKSVNKMMDDWRKKKK